MRCFDLLLNTGTPSGPEGEAARFPSDPLVDDEILESMEKKYYEDDFDPTEFELKVKQINALPICMYF